MQNACELLVKLTGPKLTLVAKITNILHAAFALISLCQKLQPQTVSARKAA